MAGDAVEFEDGLDVFDEVDGCMGADCGAYEENGGKRCRSFHGIGRREDRGGE